MCRPRLRGVRSRDWVSVSATSERVVVTGASRGIGRAVVGRLAAGGADVVAIGRDQARLQSLCDESGGRVKVARADLSDTAGLAPFVHDLVDAHGDVTGLVNCAGVIHYEAWDAIDAQSIEEQLVVNLLAPLALSRALAVHMRDRGTRGAIVNVSSTLADRASETTIVYAASKAALNAVTRGLALELAPHGIRVNAVLPGVVDTEMVRVSRPGGPGALERGRDDDSRVAEQLDALARLHPLGRLGTPDEVAAVIVQTLYNTWQTGSLVTIDGGLTMR